MPPCMFLKAVRSHMPTDDTERVCVRAHMCVCVCVMSSLRWGPHFRCWWPDLSSICQLQLQRGWGRNGFYSFQNLHFLIVNSKWCQVCSNVQHLVEEGGILTSRQTASIALIYKLGGFQAANGTWNGAVAEEWTRTRQQRSLTHNKYVKSRFHTAQTAGWVKRRRRQHLQFLVARLCFHVLTALKCAYNSLGADFLSLTGAVLQDPREKVAFSVLFF